MEEPMKGDVVVVPFPFSELTDAKRRPALVVASLPGDDRILCQITSRPIRDSLAVSLEDDDFREGGLRQSSNIRPNRLFTADRRLILYRIGRLSAAKLTEAVDAIVKLFQDR
ncbi:MAG: type II toxin-antitoxin system PemK/MazF family toxin [Phycisphaerales bacterium]|nr:type II toxin-antitoxin system PemK/MazF family toxin [Phycisphaerales bacterium]